MPQTARLLGCGPQPLYRYVPDKQLRVVVTNERGDLRTTRAWLDDFRARRAVGA